MDPRYPEIVVLLGGTKDKARIINIVATQLTMNGVSKREVLLFANMANETNTYPELMKVVLEWVFIE